MANYSRKFPPNHRTSKWILLPSTPLSDHFHLVFSTKDRHPFLTDTWRKQLHECLGGLTSRADAIPEAIGGTADNVYILVGLRAMHSLATFVKDIKQSSSSWVHERMGMSNFAWQPDYGAFTVSLSHCHALKTFIANRIEHHRERTFQEEYLSFLQKHRVTYDESYLW